MNEQRAEEAQMRMQALVDNELPAEEIGAVVREIASDPTLTDEYARLLALKQRLGAGPRTQVPDEWLRTAEKKIMRRITRGTGIGLFLGSYLLLLGYALYTLFADPQVPVVVAILATTLVAGLAFLLTNAIADRVRESKSDRYKGVIR